MTLHSIKLQNTGSKVYLDDLGTNFAGTCAELLSCPVGILSVDHTDVGTTSRRDHLGKVIDRKLKNDKTWQDFNLPMSIQ